MGKLDINLHGGKTAFVPCERVEGRLEWMLDGTPRSLELSLFWYTAGKGTRDVGVVQTIRLDAPGSYGAKEFSFTLPDRPYSFSGKLISLIWALELTCSPGSDTVRREITVAPAGREILLGRIPARDDSPLPLTLGHRR